MPHYVGRETIVVGDEPASFWHGVVTMVDGVLTSAERAEAEATYGTMDGRIDMAPFADLLVVRELGHLFHEQVPFSFPRLWLMELFANLCVHAYLAAREPERMRLWTVLPERVAALPRVDVPHHSLHDFERLYAGMDPENYCWYQFNLAAARGIYDAGGTDALRRLYQVFATYKGEFTDWQLADLLREHVHPTAARARDTWPR